MPVSQSWCVNARTMRDSVLIRMKAFKKRVRGETSTLTGVFCGKVLPLGSDCVYD